ncbi:MAG: hypothetical protein IJZ50_07760 [Alistipes sp.]|nr:hypothetical protein [Alistipes sp.]
MDKLRCNASPEEQYFKKNATFAAQRSREEESSKSKESASKKRNPLYHSDPLDPSAVAGAWNKRNSNN